MIKKQDEYEKAIKLRKQGLSLKEISKELNISKGTASIWLKDIEVPEQFRNRLRLRKIYFDNANNKRQLNALEKRISYQNNGRDLAKVSGLNLFQMGCMIYWCEGRKSSNCNSITFSNSDTYLMKLFIRFLRECFNVKNDKILIVINCYLNNGKTQEEIENYWLNQLELDRTSLRKTQVDKVSKRSKFKRGNTLIYGTCHVYVHSTELIQIIYGAIQEYGGFERKQWVEKPIQYKQRLLNEPILRNNQTEIREYEFSKCIDCGCEISTKSSSRCRRCAAIEMNKVNKRVERPSKEELIELIKNNSLVQVGKMFGVSDNAIRKWCKTYEIDYKQYMKWYQHKVNELKMMKSYDGVINL